MSIFMPFRKLVKIGQIRVLDWLCVGGAGVGFLSHVMCSDSIVTVITLS